MTTYPIDVSPSGAVVLGRDVCCDGFHLPCRARVQTHVHSDHMDDFELIFTMLGERSTTEIHRIEDTKGVKKLKEDAKRGGKIAGVAKKELEKEIGRSVVSKSNYLPKVTVEKILYHIIIQYI